MNGCDWAGDKEKIEKDPHFLFLGLALFIFSLSAFDLWCSGWGWHDQQRIYQILLISYAAALSILGRSAALQAPIFYTLILVLILGLASSLLAEWPVWALKEWGRYGGLLALTLSVSFVARRPYFTAYVFGLLACVGFLHAAHFIIYYLMDFATGIHMLDANLLFSGFSNPRTFGQFQALLMPVLASMTLTLRKRWPLISKLSFGVLAIQWCIAMTLGGRGLWLALAVSTLIMMLATYQYRRLIAVQLCAGLVGSVIFFSLFSLVPAWMNIDPNIRDSVRGGLSGRGELWIWALKITQENLWLGSGPMHYAATHNHIAAHPHQAILQWAAEWGILATSLVFIIGTWGMLSGLARLRQERADYVGAALWLSIAGALVLAQVDGVFVMPYTESWLAILIGLAMARWMEHATTVPFRGVCVAVLGITVLLVMGNILFYEVPTLQQDMEAHMKKHHTGETPRFWSQGWIPMDGVDGVR